MSGQIRRPVSWRPADGSGIDAAAANGLEKSMRDMAEERLNMVESQIRPNQVTDARILTAMAEIPRELFVPEAVRSLAYMDGEIVLDEADGDRPARTLIAPMPLARLIQLCAVRDDDLVLDVGCASGYSSAIFARLAGAVVGLECHKGLAERATRILAELEVDNADIVTGPLQEGHAPNAPYDVILVSGAIPESPAALVRQLKEGGRLVGVLDDGGVARAHLFEKIAGELSMRPVFEAAAPILPGFERAQTFTFV